MRTSKQVIALIVGMLLSIPAFAQFKDIGQEVGVGGGRHDNSNREIKRPICACSYPLTNRFQIQLRIRATARP
jgi:hypothetical protein